MKTKITTDTQTSDIPPGFVCPITGQIMKDPVILVGTGYTYERDAISKHIESSQTDPLTQKPISDTRLVSNHATKSLIEEFLKKQRISSPKIAHETNLPKSLTETLLTAIEKNNVTLFTETLKKDSQLLFNDLTEGKNILTPVSESASLEISELIKHLLIQAVEDDQRTLIQFLLIDAAKFVDPNITSNNQTVLMVAARKNHLKTVSLLLTHPNINMYQTDPKGNTALHHAVMCGSNETVKLLVEQNLSIKDLNKENKTPLQLARENGYTELANWMQEKHRYKKIEPFLKPLKKENKKLKKELNEVQGLLKQFSFLTVNKSLDRTLSNMTSTTTTTTTTIVSLQQSTPKQTNLQNALIEAALTGNLESFKQLETDGAFLLRPNKDGVYPLTAAIYSANFTLVNYIEKKLPKDEASQQCAAVDKKKATENINRWTPTVLSRQSSYLDYRNWLIKFNGASWFNHYDQECLKKHKYENWGGWDGKNETDFIWAIGGKELCDKEGLRNKWLEREGKQKKMEPVRWFKSPMDRMNDIALLLCPSISVHNQVVEELWVPFNKLREDLEKNTAPKKTVRLISQ